jgi:general secretion pathway protein G
MWRTFSISFTTAVLAIFAFLLFSLTGCPGGGAKPQLVDADFNAITSALKVYKLDAGTYPSTEQGLSALVSQPTIAPLPEKWKRRADRIPTDPWNTEYTYRLLADDDPRGFELRSAGKDRKFGTKDDLSSLDPNQ